MNNHKTQWNQIKHALDNQRIAQAMFFVGPLHCALDAFVIEIAHLFFCKSEQNKPCLQCSDCLMVDRLEHPDMEWVKPDKSGGAIKIDQIRALHTSAYLTPQRSNYRLIIIEAADRMNTASANALLKILEEPAKHTVFILMAQQLSTVLPTILSRCHLIPFSSAEDSATGNLLGLGEKYPETSERAMIIAQAEPILDAIIALVECKQHPCAVAAQWSQFELGTLLWFLYLVCSQLQYMYLAKKEIRDNPAMNQLNKLYSLLNPLKIFIQIDKLNTILRKLSHNMNVNQTLALEDVLFSFVTEGL